ncbi:MAG TPA: DASS family sodium-coupled anion symporter [Gemmatimonadaceae bacterium]|nr:DASS family sodium-coupled anion symporter [Gemmatimonadaceae bacterium]
MSNLDRDPGSVGEELDNDSSDAPGSARTRVGLALAPILFVAILLAPTGLNPEAHRLAAILTAVVVLWVTEALPMPVTAMLGAAAAVVMGVAPAKEVFAPFADPLMFLFIGAFILARAITLHGLDRRLAYTVLSHPLVAGSPRRILFAFGAITASISAWISNTATTAMMFTIGLAILAFLRDAERETGIVLHPAYPTVLMLMTSFAASIGGLATPVGTPPNVIGIGFIRSELDVAFPFFQWMMIGVPIVVVLFGFLFFFLDSASSRGRVRIEGLGALIGREKARRGGWTRGEVSTLVAFLATVVLWVMPGVVALTAGEQSAAYRSFVAMVPEGVAAIVGASLLFLLPGASGARAITWREAAQIDWGIVLLYGGGFALGVLSFRTGLAEAMGRSLLALMPSTGDTALLVGATLVAAALSEVTSNTAAANMVVPVVISVAQAAGADPLAPALGATMGASMGFMLPVSTPCNAIVYGSGKIPLIKMIRYGVVLDIAGVIVIIAFLKLLLPLVR